MKKQSVLKRLQKYMGGRKILLPASLLSSALSAISGIAPYIFIWLIIKDLLTNNSQVAASTSVVGYAWWACGLAVLSLVFYFISLTCSHLAAFRAENNMRKTAMQKIVNMPLGFFDKNTSGRIRKIIDDDSATTHSFLAHQLPDLAGSIILPITTIAMIFIFNWQLGLACLIPLLLAFGALTYMMGGSSNEFQKKYMTALENMSSEAVEYVRGIPVVKVFQQTIFSFKNFFKSIDNYKELVTTYTKTMSPIYTFYIVIVHSFAFFLVPVAILMISNTGDYASVIVDLFLYMLITPVLSSNIMKSMYIGQNVFLAGEALDRIEKLTDVAPLIKSTTPKTPRSFSIEFKNAEFSYPETQRKVVNDISFKIPEGKTFALVGPSGGGKTTLARLIPRFWDVLSGQVLIGDVDVKDIPEEYLMEHVSFVFQNTTLLKTSLLENIKYGNPEASEDEIRNALKSAQCEEIIERLPNGLNTKIGVDGTYLSGGEQQRIALARAFLKNAPIVVLDEATAFADPENESIIQAALKELMKGKTVLMIAHRLTSIQDVDNILVIKHGEIAESGDHEKLLSYKGIYSHMWNEYQQAVEWTIESEVAHA